MSFSLSANAHHGDADPHAVENTVRLALQDLARELEDAHGVILSVTFSGSTGQGLELTSPAPAPEPEAEPDQPAGDQLEDASDPEDQPEA